MKTEIFIIEGRRQGSEISIGRKERAKREGTSEDVHERVLKYNKQTRKGHEWKT